MSTTVTVPDRIHGAVLVEPELEFFGGGRHIDIRYGLADYGPLDAGTELAPRTIRVGLVGTPATIEGAREWLDRCRDGIDAGTSRQPNLHPGFPGRCSSSTLPARRRPAPAGPPGRGPPRAVARNDRAARVARRRRLPRFARRADGAGRSIEVNAPRVEFSGDRLRLEQALANLVENALRHGAGTIGLQGGLSDAGVAMHVTDEGAGIPVDFLPAAFERFSRADQARAGGGAGLGLAIVKAIVDAHDGSITLARGSQSGSDVHITLPAVTAAADRTATRPQRDGRAQLRRRRPRNRWATPCDDRGSQRPFACRHAADDEPWARRPLELRPLCSISAPRSHVRVQR